METVKTKAVFMVSKKQAEEAVRQRIVQAARDLFFQRGFVRVTTGDIAGRIGISKATLYKVFPSKEEILRAVIQEMLNDVAAGVERLVGDHRRRFVEKIVTLFTFVARRLAPIGTALVRDLRRSAPRVWEEIEEFRRDKILKNFRVLLEAGRRGGYFRDDDETDFLLEIFLALMQQFLNPEAITKSGRSPSAAFASVIRVFFQGILTDKGRRGFSVEASGLFDSPEESVS